MSWINDNEISLEGLDKIKYRRTLSAKETEEINRRLTELTEDAFREMDQIRNKAIIESKNIILGGVTCQN